MFQKQTSMRYPTKTELAHREMIRVVQNFDRKKGFYCKNYLVDAEAINSTLNLQKNSKSEEEIYSLG